MPDDPIARVNDTTRPVNAVPSNPIGTLQKDLQNVEVFVRKLQRRAGGRLAAGVSTYSSVCTSACFSSASTLCVKNITTLVPGDPELAQVFATLHRRGIETLGEEGFMDKILEEAAANKPLDIVKLAKERDETA